MDSDDEISLSSSAMDALKAFYAERDEHARRFAELKVATEAVKTGEAPPTAEAEVVAAAVAAVAAAPLPEPLATIEKPLTMALFTEDWNESQFWYADETASLYARQLLDGAGPDSLIAVVSAPSVFVALKNILVTIRDEAARPKLLLLEHDHRFAVFPEFVFYDYNFPTKLPARLRGAADRVIVDPPFLSDDCQTKSALTARWLAPEGRVIVSTGERMAPLITEKLYKAQGVRVTTYEPVHARGLGNEFYCYTNFECDDWKWRAAD